MDIFSGLWSYNAHTLGPSLCGASKKNAHLLKLVGSLIPNAHKNHVKALAQTTDP